MSSKLILVFLVYLLIVAH